MYKIIAFDLDGTLADTIPMCIKAFRNSVSPYAGHELSKQEIIQTFGLNEIGMIKAVVKNNWQAALKDFYVEYNLLHDSEPIKPFKDILEMLYFLKQQKIILSLITGKGEKSCNISLEKLGLTGIFDDILCGSEIAPNKHEHILHLLKKYRVANTNFCYVGDTVGDINACAKANVACCTAAWQKSINPTDLKILKEKNPHHIFYQVKDLWDFFCKNK